jgi:MFS family permease
MTASLGPLALLTERRWWVLGVVSLLFFFITATTFSSLGGVLYVISTELHWSQSAIGTCYSVLCLACGLSSPLPAVLMPRIGTRATMTCGAGVLVAGFLLAARASGLADFMAATGLMGLGFTLTANIPSVYLLATWFPGNAARIIGFYFMVGGLGGVFGPVLINALVQAGGWRSHWLLMTLIAAGLTVLTGLVVKDGAATRSAAGVPPAEVSPLPTATRPGSDWTPREALLTRQFILIALSMLVVQTVVTTVHGMIVTHLARLGATAAFGQMVMSILGLTDSIAKGVAGGICARIGARRMLLAGLAMLCAAVVLLSYAASPVLACLFALVLGTGWGAAWLSLHLLLLEYFGRSLAAQMLSTATLITTVAVVGPIAAGRIADLTGTFVPFFYALAAVMLINAAFCLTLRPPVRVPSAALAVPEAT